MHKQIELWKHKYGRVFKLMLEGQEVYFRPLTCSEITYVETKDDQQVKIIPELVILNDVKLQLPGSLSKVSAHVIKESAISDDQAFQLKVLQNKNKVHEDIVLTIISMVCAIYPGYTPDDLLAKTIAQLLVLAAMAEISSETNFLSDKSSLLISTISVSVCWTPSRLMDESTDALSMEMAKHGQVVPTLSQVKNNGADLTDLQRQMRQLDGI